MNHVIHGKGDKVAATKGMITAQNPTPQSKKLFGVFTEREFENIVYNAEKSESFQKVLYLRKAEEILDKARMSEDNKKFIKGAFQLMAGYGKWETEVEYEFCPMYEADGIRNMAEENAEDAVVAIIDEMGGIYFDFDPDTTPHYSYPEDEVEKVKEFIDEILEIIEEFDMKKFFDEKFFREIDEFLYKH